MAPWWPFVALLTVLALAFGIVVYHGYCRPLSRLGRLSGIPKSLFEKGHVGTKRRSMIRVMAI